MSQTFEDVIIPDMLLLVFNHLSPIEILSVQSTSKYFFKASKKHIIRQRVPWITDYETLSHNLLFSSKDIRKGYAHFISSLLQKQLISDLLLISKKNSKYSDDTREREEKLNLNKSKQNSSLQLVATRESLRVLLEISEKLLGFMWVSSKAYLYLLRSLSISSVEMARIMCELGYVGVLGDFYLGFNYINRTVIRHGRENPIARDRDFYASKELRLSPFFVQHSFLAQLRNPTHVPRALIKLRCATACVCTQRLGPVGQM